MNIRPIRTDEDHTAAVKEIAALLGAAPRTPDGERLDVLATLVDAYEDRRWTLPDVDPVVAIRQSMAKEGRTQADLAALLGSAPRTSKVLRRIRALTLPMIWALHQAWRNPAKASVKPYPFAA